MAQSDLYDKLVELKTIAEGTGKTFRAKVVDTFVHELFLDEADIAKQIAVQIEQIKQSGSGKGAKQTLSTDATNSGNPDEFIKNIVQSYPQAKIAFLAKQYVEDVTKEFKNKPPRGYSTEVSVGPGGTRILFYPKGTEIVERADQSPLVKFGAVGAVFNSLRETLANGRTRLFNQIRQEFKVTIDKKEHFFEVGHFNTAVSELRAGSILKEIKSLDQEVLSGFINYSMVSDLITNKADLIKKFEAKIAYVKPESRVINNIASKKDGEVIKAITNALETLLKDPNWATQRASNSLIEEIALELMGTATKGRAEVKSGIKRTRRGRSKASLKPTEVKTRVRTTKYSSGDMGLVGAIPQSSAVNLNSLIPVINARLPEIIRSHMGMNGALRNRTGRFSENAQVLDMGDGTLLTYTYMKYPYQVFESQGAKDPRPLIEKSIRQLAVGLVQRKFDLRRV